MRRLLYADTFRLFRSKWFWLCLGGMIAMSVAFIIMQLTAMDYEVPLSRVIFLPMSFYGVTIAAFISLFVGEDYSDGFIRNKIIAGHSRYNIFASSLIVSWLAGILIYLMITLFTAGVGSFLFEINVTVAQFCRHLLLGIGMSIAYGCIYCTITMLCGNRTNAVLLCMGLAFFLLFFCLHTNQVMVQPEYKDGVLNPAYVDGILKSIYAILHDLNPSGQAAQLSAMEIFSPVRCMVCDFLWIMIAGVGAVKFTRKNIL